MKSTKEIIVGAVYSYMDKAGTLPMPVEVVEIPNGSKTAVVVKDVCKNVPGKRFVVSNIQFETHVSTLTKTDIDTLTRTRFVPGSREKLAFES